jgi:hypothetical protein
MTMQHVSAASRALMVETFSTSTTLDVVFYHFEASDAGMTLISIPITLRDLRSTVRGFSYDETEAPPCTRPPPVKHAKVYHVCQLK